MSKPPVIFNHVIPESLYGRSFEGIELTDLVQGVNVVYGPNAAGKTTLARIIQDAIWPSLLRDLGPSYKVRFTLENQEWLVEARQGIITRNNGVKEGGPSGLPGPDDRKHYYLHLHDLFGSDDNDFAQKIVREMAGGYDVRLAADKWNFRDITPKSGKQTRELAKAREYLSEVRQERSSLIAKEKEREQLSRQLVEARNSAAKLEFFNNLKRYLEAKAAAEEAQRTFDTFPASLENATGEEYEDLRTLKGELEEVLKQIEGSEDTIRELSARIESKIFDEVSPEDTFFDRLRLAIDSYKTAEQEYQFARDTLTAARKVEENQIAAIDSEADPERLDQLGVGEIDNLARLCQELEKLDTEIAQHESAQTVFAVDDQLEDPDLIREGARQLENWLSNDRQGAASSFEAFSVAFFLIAICLVSAALLGWYFWHNGQLMLLVPALLFFYFYFLIRGWRHSKAQENARKNFEASRFNPPQEWTAEFVRRLYRDMQTRYGKSVVAVTKQNEWKQAAEKLKHLQAEREKLKQRLDDYAESLGASNDLFPTSLYYFAHQIRQFQSARIDKTQALSKLLGKQEALSQSLDEVNVLLADVQEPPVDSVNAAESVRLKLEKQFAEWRTDSNERKREQDNLLRSRNEAEKIASAVAGIYDRLEVPHGNDALVVQLCSKFDEFKIVRNDRDHSAAVLDASLKALESESLYLPEWKNATLVEVQELLRTSQVAGSTVVELTEKIAGIEKELEVARSRNDLEKAQVRVRLAENALRKERDDAIEAAAGWELSNYLVQDTTNRQQPAVFQRARDIFGRITANKYTLRMDQRNVAFSAMDNERGKNLTLDELSSGTRIQLLIAVRLAFVEQQESEVRLPLILDETLANSDSERSKAVMDALVAIARTGRQIFYFTAREEEAAKWKERQHGENKTHIKLFGLSESTQPEHVHSEAVPDAIRSPHLLVPDRHYSHDELLKVLQVPLWSAHSPTGSLHLWYLIEDPEILIRFVRSGYRTWGQFRQLDESAAQFAGDISVDAFNRIGTLGRVIEVWTEHWKIGRGTPVTRQTLEDSNVVSSTFMDAVSDLSETLNGNAEMLLEELRNGAVARYRKDSIDQLERYFFDKGYTSDEDVLERDEILVHVMNALGKRLRDVGLSMPDITRMLNRIADREAI